MKLLGIDLETTGLDIKNDRIIEIAAVLWDTDLMQPVWVFSEFMYEADLPFGESWANGGKVPITLTMLSDYGCKPKYIVHRLKEMFDDDEVEFVVAHNGTAFDKLFLEILFEELGYDLPDIPWIDTMTDVGYPADCVHTNLMYLSAYHGFVNPFPHRALFDVMTMFKILMQYDLDSVIEVSKSPLIEVRACVSFEDKDKAKAEKFLWNPDEKLWIKKMKEVFYDPKNYDFKTVVLGDRK
ncbi:MAG: 3'-5' exonuclease [Candidatus Hodarchaeales archaeon]